MIKVMSSNRKLLSLMLAIFFFFLWYWNNFEGDEYVVNIIEG